MTPPHSNVCNLQLTHVFETLSYRAFFQSRLIVRSFLPEFLGDLLLYGLMSVVVRRDDDK